MFTRREFGMLTLAGLVRLKPDTTEAAAAGAASPGVIDSKVNGVRLGVQTYSFRDLPRTASGDAIDPILDAMKACGFGECELFAPQVEPVFNAGRGAPQSDVQKMREAARQWRLETPIGHFRQIKKKFDAAGISIHAYNYSPNASYSDEEIDRGFEMTKALGAGIITASTTVEVAKRIAPFAEKHKMVVAMHGHSNIKDPNEFATPESFAAAMKMSSYFMVNLDIGHFTAANYDAVAYIREHHARITNLHLKDRKKNQGDNLPWGQGETPIREVLQLLKKEKWPIPAYVEYEYKGAGTSVEEAKKCLAYAKDALA